MNSSQSGDFRGFLRSKGEAASFCEELDTFCKNKKIPPFVLPVVFSYITLPFHDGTRFTQHKWNHEDTNEALLKVRFNRKCGRYELLWGSSSRSRYRRCHTNHITLVGKGQITPTWSALKKSGFHITEANNCFSICCTNLQGTQMIVDLEHSDAYLVALWVQYLRGLIGQSEDEAVLLTDAMRKFPPIARRRRHKCSR